MVISLDDLSVRLYNGVGVVQKIISNSVYGRIIDRVYLLCMGDKTKDKK